MTTVSVIIPVYNTEPYLPTCLDSVKRQTLTDFEVIMVDDGSSDNSVDILKSYVADDDRFSLIESPNVGAGHARNLGLAQASGQYLLFLDSDDFLEDNYLEKMVGRGDATNADVVLCRAYTYHDKTHETALLEGALTGIDAAEITSAQALNKKIFQMCKGWPWDKIFRTSYIRDLGIEFQELRTTNDAFFVFIALCHASVVAFVDDALIYHRIANSQSLENTRSKSWQNSFAAIRAIKDKLVEDGLYEEFGQSFDNWVANYLVWHFDSLPDETKQTMEEPLRDIVTELLNFDDPDYYYEFSDYSFASKLGRSWVDLVYEAHDQHLHRKYAEAMAKDGIEQREAYIGELKEWNEGLQNHVNDLIAAREDLYDQLNKAWKEREAVEAQLAETTARLEGEVSQLEGEKNELEQQIEDLRHSLSFRLGRVVTAAPRALRNAVKR